MLDFLKSFLPRAVQDIVTAGVGYLAAHGYVTADQTQSLIGSVFFIVMLIVNRLIANQRKTDAAIAGGLAVANQTSEVPSNKTVVSAIVKNAGVVK